ncbi:hypothetical protein MHU86_17082 [Fragilaria crotonensis]|nr:hypothetical protein MHU86_17082 [Fragilaria crotonensis]
MKHVHDQQPLGKRLNRIAPIPDPTLAQCPCCKHPTEDQRHLLTCTRNPDANDAMATLRKTILTADDTHPLRYLLVAGIQHGIDHPEQPFQPATHSYPPHLHDSIRTAIDSQARIGWRHLLTGLLSSEWITLASLDMHANTKPEPKKGANRIRKCLTAIHTFTRQLWLARNAVLHADTVATTTAIARTAEQIEVSHYHQRPQLLRFDDRHLCDRNLQQLMTGSSTTRRRWLRLKAQIALNDARSLQQSQCRLDRQAKLLLSAQTVLAKYKTFGGDNSALNEKDWGDMVRSVLPEAKVPGLMRDLKKRDAIIAKLKNTLERDWTTYIPSPTAV